MPDRRKASDDGARWLITGAAGMLGREMTAALTHRSVTALDRSALDVTDPERVHAAVHGHRVVVNCAAWTDVDGAETAESIAYEVNALGALRLAEACRDEGAALVHVSTDYVFGDGARTPYPVDARVAPVSAYGRGKAAGEWAIRATLPERSWVVRTAWMYGRRTTGFVPAMLRRAALGQPVEVIADVHGQPTWSRHVAGRIVALVDACAPPGVYHAAAAGSATWYEFARELFTLAGADPELVRPVPRAAVPRPARRPDYSVLADDGLAELPIAPMSPWRDGLACAFADLTAG